MNNTKYINIELDDGKIVSAKLVSFNYLYRGLKNYYITVEDTGSAWKASYSIDGMTFYSVNRSIQETLEDIIKGIISFEKDPNYRRRLKESKDERNEDGEEVLY
jgi:hypothetical protein